MEISDNISACIQLYERDEVSLEWLYEVAIENSANINYSDFRKFQALPFNGRKLANLTKKVLIEKIFERTYYSVIRRNLSNSKWFNTLNELDQYEMTFHLWQRIVQIDYSESCERKRLSRSDGASADVTTLILLHLGNILLIDLTDSGQKGIDQVVCRNTNYIYENWGDSSDLRTQEFIIEPYFEITIPEFILLNYRRALATDGPNISFTDIIKKIMDWLKRS